MCLFTKYPSGRLIYLLIFGILADKCQRLLFYLFMNTSLASVGDQLKQTKGFRFSAQATCKIVDVT